jgi:hypothetical protein
VTLNKSTEDSDVRTVLGKAEMQDSSFQVMNPVWLRVAIVLGTALFVALAVGSAWQAYVEPLVFLRVGEGAVALLFGCFSVVGVRLIKFIHYKLEVEESSVTIRSSNESYSLRWADLRLRDRPVLQVTEVRDRDDKILYAVDWYARNARLFVQAYAQRMGKKQQDKEQQT